MKPEQAFVDTNLFLRYLVNDLPAQADAVAVLFRQAVGGKLRLVTSELVLAEIVWALGSYYQLDRNRVKEMILAILNTPGLEIPNRHLIQQAIAWYAEKGVDFIDAYNAAWALDRGLTVVYTFDFRHFRRFEGLTVRVPGSPDLNRG